MSNGALDHERSSSHTVTLTASDIHGASSDAVVTIAVNNLEEAGMVSLSNAAPKVGDAVMASLSDPDGEPSETAWQWQRGDGQNWSDIAAATSTSYTVDSADIGHLLRAVVSYADPQGPGKSASAQTETAVANDPPTFHHRRPDERRRGRERATGRLRRTAPAGHRPQRRPAELLPVRNGLGNLLG